MTTIERIAQEAAREIHNPNRIPCIAPFTQAELAAIIARHFAAYEELREAAERVNEWIVCDCDPSRISLERLRAALEKVKP